MEREKAIEQQKQYHSMVASAVVEQLKSGIRPWESSWNKGMPSAPHNPISGKRFKGGNAIWLATVQHQKGFDDNRWLTRDQIEKQGAEINQGEKGTRIEFWQYQDKSGNKLQSPVHTVGVVYNAAQTTLPPQQQNKELLAHPQAKRAEDLLIASNAGIIKDQNNYYSPFTDKIHLRSPEQGYSTEQHYSDAFKQLSHWTAHESRLNRDIRHPFGTSVNAGEELRAHIAGSFMSAEASAGYSPSEVPGQTLADQWIKALEKDPTELFRAARDSEQMQNHVVALSITKQKEQEHTVEKEPRIAEKPKYLSVPYAEKDQASELGARWDKNEKLWFAPAGKDLNQFTQWLPENNKATSIKEDPHIAFGEALKDAGFVIKGTPIMDGKLHRVPLEGDKKGKKNGAYVGYLDGMPTGVIKNWKEGTREVWKGQGNNLSPEQRKALQAEAAEQRKQREAERSKLQSEKARKCEYVWKNLLKPADPEHPYLKKKGIGAHGLQQNDKGDLVIPAGLVDGRFKTIQMIKPEGVKLFAKDSNNEAAFHLIPGKTKTTDNIILVASGYATAASGHEATGRPVAVAFNDWNLRAVAEAIIEKSPEKKVLILGDDDHIKEKEGKGNSGKTKSTEAAQAVGGKAVFPRFTKEELGKGLTDFNDLHKSRGKDAVAWQVNTALKELQKEMQQAQKKQLDKAFKLGMEKEKQKQQGRSIAL